MSALTAGHCSPHVIASVPCTSALQKSKLDSEDRAAVHAEVCLELCVIEPCRAACMMIRGAVPRQVFTECFCLLRPSPANRRTLCLGGVQTAVARSKDCAAKVDEMTAVLVQELSMSQWKVICGCAGQGRHAWRSTGAKQQSALRGLLCIPGCFAARLHCSSAHRHMHRSCRWLSESAITDICRRAAATI